MRAALALFVMYTNLVAQQPTPKSTTGSGANGKSGADQKKADQKNDTSTTTSFLIWLARVSGLSANSSGLKGDDGKNHGDIWIEPITGGARRRVTFEGGYSWPIFSPDDKAIIALRGGDLWSAPINGGNPARLIQAPAATTTLVASGPDGIVLLTDQRIGTLAPSSGQFSPFRPTSKEDQKAIDGLRAPVRSYSSGDLTVSETNGKIEVERKGRERVEVAPQNASVAEPSVSHDGQWLVYVRSDNAPK